jgi:hypothetical protein
MKFNSLDRFRTGGTSSHMELSIPLPRTPDGRIYRFSPNEQAYPRHFVLGECPPAFVVTNEARKRMKQNPRSPQTVCPYSGMVADDDEFHHPEDVKAAHKMVEHAAMADVERAVNDMLGGWERAFSNNKFIKVTRTGRSSPRPRPRFYRRDLLRELVCDHCGRDYGVFAIGLFCPDCGAPNLRLHFAREVELVSQQADLADTQQGKEELAYRLMGNAHEDVLTAFEATQKAVYRYGITQQGLGPKPVKNEFQNVEAAQRRFAELGIDPYIVLTADELEALKLNIQKRHIIGHNLGVMDEKFADHASDARLGETMHLVGEDIRAFATLVQRVVDALDAWLIGGVAAPNAGPAVSEPIAYTSERKVTGTSDLGISENSSRIGKWIAQQSANGRDEFVDLDALTKEFGELNINELAEAIAELALEDYVTTSATMAHVLPYVRPTPELFAEFDPRIGVGEPTPDSVTLANQILQGSDSVNIPSLHQTVNWPLRRFNPAIALVVPFVDERRVSKANHPDYPVMYFVLNAEDRVRLRRYAEQVGG